MYTEEAHPSGRSTNLTSANSLLLSMPPSCARSRTFSFSSASSAPLAAGSASSASYTDDR